MGRKYRVISGDGHVETAPDAWVKHVPAKYRDRAPRLVALPEGGEGWLVEGQPLLHNGQNITGRGPIKFAGGSYFKPDGSPAEGAGDAKQRLREQDEDGIDAEILFPPVFASRFIEGIADPEVYLSLVRAYNSFLAEDYCSVAPDRLIGCAVIPVMGIDAAIAELERIAELGLRAIAIHNFPNGGGSPKPEDDRFWTRALDLGIALAPHQNIGDVAAPPRSAARGTHMRAMAECLTDRIGSIRPAYCLAQMICSGLFDRLPSIQFYFAETYAAWLASALWHYDDTWNYYNQWFQLELPHKPSEYIREHVYFGIIREPIVTKLGEFVPLERLMWGSDFPHSVGSFPNSRKWLDETFGGVDEKLKRTILVDNPARFFGLDAERDLTPTPAS
jgi:predicted TIM-barrel fold metal-dependent hydrolase